MDKLPQELLQHIFDDEELSNSDLESLRLVNKALAAAAAPSLFHTISVWLSLASLERLTSIAEHHQLSSYVKQLIFSPLRFQDISDIGQYEANERTWMKYRHTSLGTLSLSLTKHVAAYKSYIEVQHRLTQRGEDLEILTWALSKLSHLEIFNFSFCNASIGFHELTEAFGPFRAGDLLTWDPDHLLPVVVRALSESQRKIKVFKLGAFDEWTEKEINLGWAAHANLFDSRPPSHPRHRSTRALSNAFSSSYEESGWNCAFSELRELEVTEIPVKENSRVSISRVTNSISNLIRSAPLLEVVSIGEIGSFDSGSFRAKLSSTFERVRFRGIKHLRELSLDCHESTDAQMLDFLKAHASTLKIVRFYHVFLTTSDWVAVIKRLREMKWPQLREFLLHGCMHEEDADSVYLRDYLTHLTNADPVEEAREEWRKLQEAPAVQ